MNVNLFGMAVRPTPGNQPTDAQKVYLQDPLYQRWYEVTETDAGRLKAAREQVAAFPEDILLLTQLKTLETGLLGEAQI